MRLAEWNIEWFNALFDDKDRLLLDHGWSGRHDVTRRQQAEAVARVMRTLDSDAMMIIEAPDSHRRRDGSMALQGFARWAGLRTTEAVIGFANQTQQEIAFLYDPSKMTARHDPLGSPRFDEVYQIDLDVDAEPEEVRWSKPPLELNVETAEGRRLRIIGVHAKSKAPHGARRPDEVMRIAIQNRRKQLAQCIWLRERVEDHLDRGEPLIVMGDFNDGPGLDEYEKLFGRSGVEIVLGDEGEMRLYDPHAEVLVSRPVGGAIPASARFWIPEKRRWMQTLLDYIMVSPALREAAHNWRIWHPFDDPECYEDETLCKALLTASDHFPVTVELDT